MEKGDERVLDLTDDLQQLPAASKLSARECGEEIEEVTLTFNSLDQQWRNASSSTRHTNRLQRNAVDTQTFCDNLGEYVESFSALRESMARSGKTMRRRVDELFEYFGEDNRSCDTADIFSVLAEFCNSVAKCRAALEKRRPRGRA